MTAPSPPLVSIVIPTYNYGHYVCEAVESALAQTHPAVEVIVVDDGSTDDTRQRLAAYGDRIRYIHQANQKLSAARNTGMNAARGEYIALLDSDDGFHPRKVELQLQYLLAHPDVGLVGTSTFIDPSRRWPAAPDSPPARQFSIDEIVTKTRFCPSSAMLRRECLASVGPFDPLLPATEDRDYWIRAAARTKIGVILAELTFYRIHPTSMSRNPERMEHAGRLVLDKAFRMKELAGRWLLRRKAMGLFDLANCYEYRGAGRAGSALRRLLRSMLWWPMPFRGTDVNGGASRLAALAVIVRDSLTRRGQASHSP
jgi:glycosyltransferase involved in cell wall biosynthesis